MRGRSPGNVLCGVGGGVVMLNSSPAHSTPGAPPGPDNHRRPWSWLRVPEEQGHPHLCHWNQLCTVSVRRVQCV